MAKAKSNDLLAQLKAAAPQLPEGDGMEPRPKKTPAYVSSAEGMAAMVALSWLLDDIDVPHQGVYDEFRKRADEARAGSLALAERMLMSQALSLQVVYTQLMSRSSRIKDIKRLQPMIQLALKAQSNCRVTLETLNEFKNPRQVAFVRQTNVANGPQQVNNGTEPKAKPARAHGKTQTAFQTNELLEGATDAKRLDTGAPRAPGAADSKLGTVGIINRAAKPTGQGEKRPKRHAARATLEAVE